MLLGPYSDCPRLRFNVLSIDHRGCMCALQIVFMIMIMIIMIIRFYGLSKLLAFIAQLVAVHEFVQSGLEDLQ